MHTPLRVVVKLLYAHPIEQNLTIIVFKEHFIADMCEFNWQ